MLSSAEFKNKVVGSDGVWMVEFFAPWCGHCKSLVPEWEKAAKALKGVVHIGGVDATQEQSLAQQYSIKGFPTILIFGLDKAKPDTYQGARTAEAITDAGLKAAQAVVKARLSGKKSGGGGGDSGKGGSKGSAEPSDVVELTDSNFDTDVLNSNDPWLIEFYAPWCGHCKNLAPEWAKAATELKGIMKLGAVDATQYGGLAQNYDVRGYPTIKFFPPGEKAAPLEYDGGRNAHAIVEWCVGKLEDYGHGPEIVEATSDEVLKESCLAKKICVVSVLPHIIDTGAKGRQEYLDTVMQVAKKLRTKPMGFVWIGGTAQQKFEDTFGVALNYPTMVAISASKMRWAGHHGAFATQPLAAFLSDVWAGRHRTKELKELPALATVAAWDGGDYVPPPEETYDEE